MDRRTARWYSIRALRCLGYEWLACDKDGTMLAYEDKPFKLTEDEWNFDEVGAKYLLLDNAHDIDFVTWEDEEPTNITEWIKKEEEDMKMYSIKDGKLECEEVDTTNGMVALAHNEEVVPDGKNGFKVIARGSSKSWEWLEGLCNTLVTPMHPQIQVNADNWGKSFIKEYGDRITEALTANENVAEEQLEMFKKMNTPILPGINVDGYPDKWISDAVGHNLENKILDVASLYPQQVTLEDLDNVKIHEKVCEELSKTYEKKNSDYGNSFENSLDKHGMIAGIVRMDDKMSRLISLNSKNEQLVMDESMRDTLMDLANYAIMSVMWLDEQ